MKKMIDERIWVWGGPTPSWGGSMEKDCLKNGAEYFDVQSVIYAYGPHTDEMFSTLKSFKRVVCQIGANCRTEGAQIYDSVKEAEELSRFSLKYPNIEGAIFDDFDTGKEKFSTDRLAEIQKALKKHNQNLRLHVVTYTHADHSGFGSKLPYIDVVTVWVWTNAKHQTLEQDIDLARKDFPEKDIYMGVFLHDYGSNDADKNYDSNEPGVPMELLFRQIQKGTEWLASGKIQGMIILGDREIKKHPEQAALTKKFLHKNLTVC